jgi:hypothetical protein
MLKWIYSTGQGQQQPSPFSNLNSNSPPISPYLTDEINLPLPGSTSTSTSNSPSNDINKDELINLNSLLEPFKANQLPRLARTDPKIKQIQPPIMSISKLWQYLPFLATQGNNLLFYYIIFHLPASLSLLLSFISPLFILKPHLIHLLLYITFITHQSSQSINHTDLIIGDLSLQKFKFISSLTHKLTNSLSHSHSNRN